MINNVVLVGRITKDPEVRKTQSGVSVTSFTLAVNRTFAKDDQQADFIRVTAWRHSADFLGNYIHKGDLLGVTGRIETGSYEDKQGNMVYTTDIQADNVQQLESRKEKEQRQQIGSDYIPQHDMEEEVSEQQFAGPTLDISSDDLPF